MRKLVYTKADNWSYEREWRIFAGVGDMPGDYEDIPFHPLELEGVILGCKMPETEREEFAELVRSAYPHSTISAATTASKDFRLIIGEWPF